MGTVLLIVTLLAFTEVRCKEFKVYWNIPTVWCKNYNISFDFVAEKYGITQNSQDEFKGDKITILYNPGLFPAVYNYTHNYSLTEQNLKNLIFVNGGIPQYADTTLHFFALKKVLDRDIPHKSYSGIVVIDMEHFGGTWAQNFNEMEINKILSRKRVQTKNPTWSNAQVEKQAKKEYEGAATRLLYTTLVYAKMLRPNAKWGFYQYPQCFNKPGVGFCSNATQTDNNQMFLIWRGSDALYPSLYLSDLGTFEDRAVQIKGMVNEANRVQKTARVSRLNIPYVWHKYHHKPGNINDIDLENLIRVPKDEGADGIIIWGSWHDVNSKSKCHYFLKYVLKSLGPIAKKYVSREKQVEK